MISKKVKAQSSILKEIFTTRCFKEMVLSNLLTLKASYIFPLGYDITTFESIMFLICALFIFQFWNTTNKT